MNLPQLPNRPILLTTTVPVPVGAVREPQDKYALQPAFNEALLLDEIRFDYLRPQTGLPTAAQGVNPWNDIRVELTMGGSISFTYQPVPLSALNTSPNPYLWNFAYNSVVFRLPKPLYLNPGDMFVPRFHNNWINDVDIQVTYAARRTPVRPAENWYPYVSSFTSQQFNVLPGTDSFLLESTPSDLVNPYDVPLLVDRLVGFIGTNAPRGYFGQVQRNPCDYAGDYLNVRLFDSAERPIVRDLTPFNMLFNLQGRAWQMKSILHPHEYYLAQISYENNAAQFYDPPLLPPPSRQPSSMTANIVMIGSRRADAAYTKRRLDSLDIPTKFGPAKVRPDWNLPKFRKG